MSKKDTKKWERERFRELTEDEQDLMYNLFCLHFGNCSMVGRSKESIVKGKDCISYWAKLYDWDDRMRTETDKRVQELKKAINAKLVEGKQRAISRALWLLEERQEEKVTSETGKKYKVKIVPSNKDIKTAYDIIKTELGEPSSVKQNLNVNEADEETVKALDAINKLINIDVTDQQPRQKSTPVSTKTVQSGGATRSDSAKV